jgi:hypothetical protein
MFTFFRLPLAHDVAVKLKRTRAIPVPGGITGLISKANQQEKYRREKKAPLVEGGTIK